MVSLQLQLDNADHFTFVAPLAFNTFRGTRLGALARIVAGLTGNISARSVKVLRVIKETAYPQLRQANLSLRFSVQSRARWPGWSQLTHLTSTLSTCVRSSLQPREVCPISSNQRHMGSGIPSCLRGNCYSPPQLPHLGTPRSRGYPPSSRRLRFSSADSGQRSLRLERCGLSLK